MSYKWYILLILFALICCNFYFFSVNTANLLGCFFNVLLNKIMLSKVNFVFVLSS